MSFGKKVCMTRLGFTIRHSLTNLFSNPTLCHTYYGYCTPQISDVSLGHSATFTGMSYKILIVEVSAGLFLLTVDGRCACRGAGSQYAGAALRTRQHVMALAGGLRRVMLRRRPPVNRGRAMVNLGS
jgi:hypothetical protein